MIKNSVSPKSKQDIVKFCLDRKALRFGNFTLKSGRKSPVFFNIFLTINDAVGLDTMGRCYADLVVDFLWEVLVGKGKSPEKIAQLQDRVFLFGPAYKGIPLAAIAANYVYREKGFNFRWGYDRKEAKTHGEKSGGESAESLVDGDLREGDQVIIIDDVLTEGAAKIEGIEKIAAYAAAKKVNVKIAGIATFVDRWEGGKELRAQYPVRAALRMDDVAKVARAANLISQEDFDRYAAYFKEFGLK